MKLPPYASNVVLAEAYQRLGYTQPVSSLPIGGEVVPVVIVGGSGVDKIVSGGGRVAVGANSYVGLYTCPSGRQADVSNFFINSGGAQGYYPGWVPGALVAGTPLSTLGGAMIISTINDVVASYPNGIIYPPDVAGAVQPAAGKPIITLGPGDQLVIVGIAGGTVDTAFIVRERNQPS